MNYSLGYDERCTDTFLARGAEQQCLNLAPFVHTVDDGSASEQFDGMLSALRARLATSDSLVTSNEPLATDLRAALRRKVVLSNDEYARVNTLITLYIRKFHGDAQPKVAWIRCPGSHPDAWEPNTLYGRYGNVELRVLENWLQDREGLLVEYRKVMEQHSDEDYMYCDQASRHWLSSDDKNYNLRKLMTNAGFYPGLVDGEEDLNCWAEEFLAALAASKSLFSYPMAYPFYFATQGHLFAKCGVIADYIKFPQPEAFYAMLAEHDVLFVTPFAAEVGENFATGQLFQLYTDIVMPTFSLRTLKSHVSTYPNRPHGSWRETYQSLIDDIDKAYRERPFSLFFAASGCYGMPLCRYVYKRYGCASVYYGNHLNTLFGVRMACNEDFLTGRRNLQYWAHSRLGEVKNMNRIDGGRYT